jgi:hypothetical protein
MQRIEIKGFYISGMHGEDDFRATLFYRLPPLKRNDQIACSEIWFRK